MSNEQKYTIDQFEHMMIDFLIKREDDLAKVQPLSEEAKDRFLGQVGATSLFATYFRKGEIPVPDATKKGT